MTQAETLWLRVDRAEQRLSELKSNVDGVLSRYNNNIVTGHLDTRTGQYVWRMDEPFPLEWGLTLGEFAHHARSVLDNLISSLASRWGSNHRGTSFVVADTQGAWNGAIAVTKNHRSNL